MANNSLDFMKDVLAAPLGEVISSVGQGVAEAQAALDAGSLEATLAIYSETDDEGLKLLREIGYRPTFYAIPETEVETTISLSISSTTNNNPAGTASSANSESRLSKTRIYATPVNASVQNRYNFNAQASTKMKFKIVPVPPTSEVSDIRVMPDLNGKTKDEAETLLTELSISFTYTNPTSTGTVIDSQSIAAGALVQAETVVELTIKDP